MKDIQFTKEGELYIFNFYFTHNAQILLSITGGLMILIFSLFYMIKPYFDFGDEGFFLVVLFIASAASLHIYSKYHWLSLRNRLEITGDEILFYHASFLYKKLKISEVTEIVKGKKYIFIFGLNSIEIKGGDESIIVAGFKKGEDIDEVEKKIKDIITRKTSE